MGHSHRQPRIRQKGEYILRSGNRFENYTWPGTYPNPHQVSTKHLVPPKKYELMWDTTGYLDNDFNPCWHEKTLCPNIRPLRAIYRVPGEIGPSPHITYDVGLYPDPVAVAKSAPLDLQHWLEDFGANATRHFIQLVGQDGSLVNFLLEMKDICEFNIKTLKKIGDTILKALKTFRDLFAKTGKFWLAWNFAIKPSMKDLWNMLHTLERARKRLKWLRERNHKDTKVKYREGPRDFSGDFVGPYPTVQYGERIIPPPDFAIDSIDTNPGSFVELHCAYEAKVSLSSWAWVRFDIDDVLLDDLYGLGIVVSAIQGLYNPMSITWEAIPFSWLVDWFRSQKSKIDQYLAGDLNPLGRATIIQTGWSIKATIRGEMVWIHQPDEFRNEPAGDFLFTCFVRQPGLPSEGPPLRIPFQWYNLSILLALIAQKRRRG